MTQARGQIEKEAELKNHAKPLLVELSRPENYHQRIILRLNIRSRMRLLHFLKNWRLLHLLKNRA